MRKFFDAVKWSNVTNQMLAMNIPVKLVDKTIFPLIYSQLMVNRSAEERKATFQPKKWEGVRWYWILADLT